MALAGAGLADEVDHLVLVDEIQAGQRHDAVAVERGLEREVEARERLDGGEPGHLQRSLDASPLADGELLGEQGVDRLNRAGSAALELPNHAIERFQGARHAQGHQVLADALDGAVRGSGHAAAPPCVPSPARRLPTAS